MSVFDITVQAANRIYVMSWYALSAAIFLAAISTLTLFWATTLKADDRDTRLEQARQSVSSVNQAVERIQNTMDQLQGTTLRRTAEATNIQEHVNVLKTEIATLEAEKDRIRAENTRLSIQLEQEKTTRLKLQMAFAPRQLLLAVRESLANDLRGKVRSVKLEIINDPEALSLSQDLEDTFQKAGLEIQKVRLGSTKPTPVGVIISDSQEGNMISKLLEDVGIITHRMPWNGFTTTVLVGVKPPTS